jgi:hypothetical protein
MNKVVAQRIAAFREVRDMPYYIATRGENDCCCSSKAYLLEKKLRALGLQCRHVLCWFTWESLRLPASVLAIAHEKIPSHQFLEVQIPETKDWVVVDPTWDSGLSRIFQVNDWDGMTATACAVPIYRLCTAEESAKIFKECEDSGAMSAYFEDQGPFLRAVNVYLQEARSKTR